MQNEFNFDLKNPRVFYFLRRMHQEDPCRTVVLKSGVGTDGEAWMKPYADTVYYDHGDGVSGWADQHTVGYPDGIWQDGDYQGPTNFVYRNTDTKQIIDYGEMAGAGVLDDSALMVRQIAHLGGTSYDLQDHQNQLTAYDRFLDRREFRQAFPTMDLFFRSLGDKQYDLWDNLIECARLADASDYLTISGWETTAIDDYSGLVDTLRNLHGDPALIRDSLRPLLPVVRVRQSAVAPGATVTYDLYLLNETDRPAPGTLHLTLTDPQGRVLALGKYPAPVYHAGQFVYPLQAGLTTPPLTQEGLYRLTFALGPVQETRAVRVVGLPRLPGLRVGVVGADGTTLGALNALPGVTAAAGRAARRRGRLDGRRASLQRPGRYGDQGHRRPRPLPDPAVRDRRRPRLHLPGPAQVTLYFADTYDTQPGRRVFDVRINGQTVLHDLDIVAQAGGGDTALTRTFSVAAPDGTVTVRPGPAAVDNRFCDRNRSASASQRRWKAGVMRGRQWNRIVPRRSGAVKSPAPRSRSWSRP